MFDTTPKISNDPKHLDEYERIFGHGKYADKKDCCQEETKCKDKQDCDCKK